MAMSKKTKAINWTSAHSFVDITIRLPQLRLDVALRLGPLNYYMRDVFMPLLSIIVPVYNVAPYLGMCLDSLRSQSLGDWECICIDDGSTDESGNILDEYMKKDCRFHVFHQQNTGVSAARNLGISKAKGQYLWFVDGDDRVMPKALNVLNTALVALQYPDILALGWCRFESQAAPVFHEAEHDNAKIKGQQVHHVKDRLSIRGVFQKYAGSLICWNALYRREGVSGLFFRAYTNGEDVLWGIEALLMTKSIGSVENVCYGYFQRQNSACRRFDERHLVSSLTVAKEIIEQVRNSTWGNSLDDLLLQKIRTVANSVAYQPVNALGKRGYDIWMQYAQEIYLDSGLLKGFRKEMMNFLLLVRSRFLIWLFCFFPMQAKGYLLKNSLVTKLNKWKNLRRVRKSAK